MYGFFLVITTIEKIANPVNANIVKIIMSFLVIFTLEILYIEYTKDIINKNIKIPKHIK